MINNIIVDVSKLTKVPMEIIESMSALEEDCISHCVMESMLKKESLTSVDIGIGTLYILVEDSAVKYKFIPSTMLESKVNETLKTKKSSLIKKGEKSLKTKIEGAYKNLL